MTDTAIVPETIRALGALYFAAQLEELRMFDVVDRLVERFLGGLLPVGQSSEALREWPAVRTSPSLEERRDLYARAFGLPGGDPGGLPNSEFGDLWLRFLAAVAALDRSPAGGGTKDTPAGDPRHATAAARALAVHLSACTGPAAMAGPVERQTRKAIDVLSDPEIQSAYGARDVAGLIDSVALMEFGGARDSARILTEANSGVAVFAWLAQRSADPTDADLVHACEHWLAVAGISALLSRSVSWSRLAPDARDRIVRTTSEVAAALVAAVDFPAFVADLINGVFEAIVDLSIRQMEAYGDLVAAVADAIEEVRAKNVTEVQARDRIVDRFPDLFPPAADPCDLPRLPETRYPVLARLLATGITRLVAIPRRHS
jgi:hypothetical protein